MLFAIDDRLVWLALVWLASRRQQLVSVGRRRRFARCRHAKGRLLELHPRVFGVEAADCLIFRQ